MTQFSHLQNRDRNNGQWNRIKSPEINPHTDSQLTFNYGNKNIQWRKDSLVSKQCWESLTATCKSVKLEHTLTLYTKINSKWLKDLNTGHHKTPRGEHSQNVLWHKYINHSNVFLDQSPKALEIKAKTNGTNQTYKLLHSKGNRKQTEETTYRLEEDICKWGHRQGRNFQNTQTAHSTQQQQNTQANQKMGRTPRQTFLQRGHSDGQ